MQLQITMKIIFSIFLILLHVKTALSQAPKILIGTWKLSRSFQADNKKCDLTDTDSTKIIFYSNSTYYWNDYGAITKGKWSIGKKKIRLYNIKAVNFKGTLIDVIYQIELKSNSLILRRPEGVEIPCPFEYYIKAK